MFLAARLSIVVGEILPVELGGVLTRASRVQTVENDPPDENRDANRDLNRLAGELSAYGEVASPFCETQCYVGGGIGGTVEP